MAKEIILKNVPIGFPCLFVPRAATPDSTPAYSLRAFIEPGSENDKAIREAIEEVAKDVFKDAYQKRLQRFAGDTKAYPYHDGDLFDWGKPEGCWVLGARRSVPQGATTGNPPKVVDRKLQPLTPDSGKIYSGAICNVKVDLWAQNDANKGSGIRCTLVSVQWVKDGTPYGGSVANTDGFEDLGDDETDDDIPF